MIVEASKRKKRREDGCTGGKNEWKGIEMYFGKTNFYNLSKEERREIRKKLVGYYLRNDVSGIGSTLKEFDYETRNIFCATNALRSSGDGLLCGALMTGNKELAKCFLSHGISPIEKEVWVREGLEIADVAEQSVSYAKRTRKQCLLELTERVSNFKKEYFYLRDKDFLDLLKGQMLLFKEKERKEFEREKTVFIPMIMAWLLSSAKANTELYFGGNQSLKSNDNAQNMNVYWGAICSWLMENELMNLEGLRCSKYKKPVDKKRFFMEEAGGGAGVGKANETGKDKGKEVVVESTGGGEKEEKVNSISTEKKMEFLLRGPVLFLVLCKLNELNDLGQMFLEKSKQLGLYKDLFVMESLEKFRFMEEEAVVPKKIEVLLGDEAGFSYISSGVRVEKGCGIVKYWTSLIEQRELGAMLAVKEGEGTGGCGGGGKEGGSKKAIKIKGAL